MGNGGVRGWRAFGAWVVSVALFAGAVGGAVLLPAEAAAAQGTAPAASGSVPDSELTVGGAAHAVGVADYFTGTVTSYSAASADTAIASVSTSGSTVTVTPRGAGSTTITVTATNTAGDATQTFATKVLPAGCLIALGTVTAGSIRTQTGTWASDDGCRATNATSTAHNRYARYVSFTVSEAVEARISLSSPQGKRLYLLEGAGTGGRILDSAGTSSTTSAASLWEALQPGTYTLETTTYYAAREADYTLSIDSMPLVPPAYCVASLGTLTAGTIRTEQGSWGRDDWCRSTNATTNQATRYYADYLSFTVTEPLEARITLTSSTQGKRLYLLEGDGTAGRVIDSSRTSSTTSAASLWEALQPGTYTLETTTYDAAREADYTLSIDSMPLVPPDYCVTSIGTITGGEIRTEQGSWDRDDWCRSTNATTSQSLRYYADYVSFTVTEPLEARITLTSSTQGKRLYLLDGDGTGGRVIDSSRTSSTTSAASLWEALQPGTYTLETTTYYAAREADYTLSIDSMPLVPPDYCVTSIGTITGGEIRTETGSWDRDDWCRSTNATTSQSLRYYADYVSFTVTEPLEARITLTSDSRARLYLLDGAGTGGTLLTSAGHSRSTSNPTFWRVLQPGTYTLETAGYSRTVEDDYSISIDSMPLVPPDYCVLSLGTLTAGEIRTHDGAWDRDDWCRSTNATTSQSVRYYADYLSFTVTEPLEARITLTSDSRARLYLLDGAGTGGTLLTSAGHSRSTSNPTFWRVLQPGTYTLETTARSRTVEDDYSISIDSMPLTPPDYCVTSIGAITAGEIRTHDGAWDRDDWCRSLNATTSQSARYYADYVSFTVTEPLEARITLTSDSRARLYLLDGAGTGGTLLTSAGHTRSTSNPTFWRVLQPGTYTLETTARSRTVEDDYSISIDSMPLVPPDYCVLSLGTLTAGEIRTHDAAWDRDDWCRSTNATTSQSTRYYADYVSFTVTEAVSATIGLTSDSRARLYLLDGAGTGGTLLTSVGHTRATSNPTLRRILQPGTYTLETTTRSATVADDYTLSVSLALLAPTRGDALQAQEIQAHHAAAQIDVSAAFNGTVESYAATSSNTSIVTTSVSGSVVTLHGVAVGTARVTVTATNAAGSTTQSFAVTVRPITAPQAAGTLAAQTVAVGATATVDVAAAFTGTVDTYSTTSSDTATLTVSTSGSVVALTGVAEGRATVTVTATNTGGDATQTMAVTVNAAAPTPTGTLAAQTITAGDTATVDIAAGFTGTVDTYSATSSDTAVVTATTTGSVVTLTGVATGTTSVTVTATNTTGSATQTLTVTVTPAAPTTTGTLAAQTVTAAATATVDVAAAFAGTVDTYSATSSDTAVVTVSTTGSIVTLTGVATGTATVTVTATNTGGSATQALTVTVAAAAPTATGTLAAQTVTAGDSVDVDVAGAFTGTVDTYTATSSNAAVLDIALAGSVVTLTGVAAGTATVTVVATNVTGSATQTLAVTVNLPPAPTLGSQLAAQTLQVTETLTIDIAAGFNGQIDTYTATSGNNNTLTATADGSHVTLTGVAAGTTTVTVTAINAAGRAARSFTVAVSALTAPQTANTPVARTIAVGEELPIHIDDAFTGIIATYAATSSDTAIATVSADGSTITLVGVAAGTATVTLAATNTAGTATQTFTVTVQAPEELTIAVAAPSHCLGSEGTLAPGGGRRGVGHINLTYHITGGAPPYTITSPDAPGTTATEPTGTLTILCSQRGIDLATAGPETNVVEAGPRTLTITATDNAGTATTTNIQIEVAENAYTTEYNGGLMHEGRTYVLGTPDQWVLITLPEGLTLQFAGLSEHNVAHFTEPATGTQILLDWTTGTELGRTTPTTSDTTTRANTPTTTTKQTSTTTTRTATTPLGRPAISTPAGLTYGADPTEWRPYAGLPNSYTIDHPTIDPDKVFHPQVAVHRRMLIGKPIRVCAIPVNSATAADDKAFKDNVHASAKAWNDRINDPTTGWTPSFPRNLITYYPSCVGVVDLAVLRVEDADITGGNYCGNDVGACARILATGTNPPTIEGSLIIVKTELAKDRSVMIHELGHFLGLGDYAEANNDKCGQGDPRRPYFASVMAGGDCREDSIQQRDLADLHLIYHPDARTRMHFYAVGASGWGLNPGDPPRDTGRDVGRVGIDTVRVYRYVSNAAGYVVFRRAFGSMGSYTYVGRFGRSASRVRPGGQLTTGSDREEIEGQVFYVFGVTGGDIEQSTSTYLEVHATLPFDLGSLTGASGSRDWTLGHGATVYGPPAIPTNVRTDFRSGEVDVVWPHVAGATDYDVYRHDTTKAIKQPTTTGGDPESFLEKQEVRASTRTSCGMRVTFDNLANGTTYYFRVRANRDGVDLRGSLSAEVSGRPFVTSSPPGSTAKSSERTGKAASAASAASCTLPEEVDPDEGDPVCPSGDGFSWKLRGVDGGDWWCDRVQVDENGVVSTVVWRCAASAGASRVEPGGEVVCEREEPGTVRSRPGPPECEEGFSLLTVLVGGVSQQVCSKTESEPATATPNYSCPDPYGLVTFGGVFCYDSEPATATPVPSCPSGYTLVTIQGQVCYDSVPATATPSYSCPDPYGLVTFGGVFCYDSEPATATPVPSCPSGYTLVTTPLPFSPPLRQCKDSVAATATPSYSCPDPYGLVTFGGVFCYDSEPATATPNYSCPSDYTLVTTPLPFSAPLRQCKDSVAATATYSCPSGYTLSGTSCYKYLYTSPTGGSCPSGYTLIYIGFTHLCRKKVTTTATVSYDCDDAPAGYTLSGSRCTHTTAPTVTNTYHCNNAPSGYTLSGSRCTDTTAPTITNTYHCNNAPSGYTLSGTLCTNTVTPTFTNTYDCDDAPPGYTLSGTQCTHTTAPTITNTYHCRDAPAGYTLSGTLCTDTEAPTFTNTYDCDDAPAGYTLSGSRCTDTTAPTVTNTYDCDDAPPGYTLSDQDCIKTTTKPPTRPTIHYCDAGYTLDTEDNTCSQTITTTPTQTTTYSCHPVPPGEPTYKLTTTTTATTTTTTCERTITIPATIPRSCPSGYNPVLTVGEDRIRITSCKLDRDTTTNTLTS